MTPVAHILIPEPLSPSRPSSYSDEVEAKESDFLDLALHVKGDEFRGVRKEDVYKILFMETKDLARGKWAMDQKEPNYLSKMLDGYMFMLSTLHESFTADLYEKLHDACSAGVISDDVPEGIPSGFRNYADGAEAFQVILGVTLSEAGYNELIQKIKTTQFEIEKEHYHPFKEAIYDPSKTIDLTGKSPSFLKLKPASKETCRFYVDCAIARYEALAKDTVDQKLIACAQLIQDLDQFHVFVDGNIRTTGIIMLNRTLLSLGLCPSVLEDVNCLDCLSLAEIVEKIKQGQEFFASLKR